MMNRFKTVSFILVLLTTAAFAEDTLQQNFQNPPMEVRAHAYWWWLNGNVTTAAITRDLEAM